jgi:hypothetical protein
MLCGGQSDWLGGGYSTVVAGKSAACAAVVGLGAGRAGGSNPCCPLSMPARPACRRGGCWLAGGRRAASAAR